MCCLCECEHMSMYTHINAHIHTQTQACTQVRVCMSAGECGVCEKSCVLLSVPVGAGACERV